MIYTRKTNKIESSKKSKINEDFFDDFNYDEVGSERETSDEDELSNLVQDINVKRSELTDVNLNEHINDIMNWLKKHTNVQRIYQNRTDLEQAYLHYDSYLPVVLINTDGTIDVFGNLVVANIKDVPEYIYFNVVHNTEKYQNMNSKPGNFEYRNCMFEELPAGTPEEVDGNFSLFNCKYLKSLMNSPKEIRGGFYASMCFELKDYTNSIKYLGKSAFIISQDEVNTEDIKAASIFNKQSRIVDERVNEAIVHRNFNTLNEAFDSDILKRLFNKPENKKAVKVVKNIPVLWSELQDFSIFPCFGGLKKILKARKESDPSKYGLTILCDKNDKISCIMSGDNKSKFMFNGIEQTWKDSSFLYASEDLLAAINRRITAAYYAPRRISDDTAADVKQKIENSRKELEDAGIDYENDDLPTIYSVSSKDKLTIPVLNYVPDYCVKGYIMKSSKDFDDNDNEFTYFSQIYKKNKMHNNRTNNILGTYITTGKNAMKSPLYKRYYDSLLLTDEVVKNLNNRKFDIEACSSFAYKAKEAIIKGASMLRDKLIKAYKENKVDGLKLDALYMKFMGTRYAQAIEYCEKSIEILNDARAELEHSPYNGFSDSRYEKNIYTNKLQNRLLDRENSTFSQFVTYTISTISKLAALLFALESYEAGNISALDEDELDKLFRQ